MAFTFNKLVQFKFVFKKAVGFGLFSQFLVLVKKLYILYQITILL